MGIESFLQFFGNAMPSWPMLFAVISVHRAFFRQYSREKYIEASVVLLRKLHDIAYHPDMGWLEDSVGICLDIHLKMPLEKG